MPVEEYAVLIGNAMIVSHLFGRYEMNNYIGKQRAKYIEMSEGDYQIHFEDIPNSFDAAVKFFLEKNIIKKPEFLKLDKKVRKYAFTVARTDSEDFLEKMKKNLSDTLQGIDVITGKKLNKPAVNVIDWGEMVKQYFEMHGMAPLADWHLKIVFLVNMRTAYNEGETAMMKETDKDEFPLWEFIAILDERTRPEHARLDGFTAPPDDPIWNKLAPPLDFGCRCRRRPVHVDEGLKANKSRPDLTGDAFYFVNNKGP